MCRVICSQGVAKSTARLVLRMAAASLTLAIASMAQTTAPSLPFVGCISYGQVEKVDAPKGVSVSRSFSSHDARNLAYYRSAEIGRSRSEGMELRRLFRFQRLGNVSQSRTDQRRTKMA